MLLLSRRPDLACTIPLLSRAGSGYRSTLMLDQCNRIGIDTSEALEVLRRCASELQEEVVEFKYRDFFYLSSPVCVSIYISTVRQQDQFIWYRQERIADL